MNWRPLGRWSGNNGLQQLCAWEHQHVRPECVQTWHLSSLCPLCHPRSLSLPVSLSLYKRLSFLSSAMMDLLNLIVVVVAVGVDVRVAVGVEVEVEFELQLKWKHMKNVWQTLPGMLMMMMMMRMSSKLQLTFPTNVPIELNSKRSTRRRTNKWMNEWFLYFVGICITILSLSSFSAVVNVALCLETVSQHCLLFAYSTQVQNYLLCVCIP